MTNEPKTDPMDDCRLDQIEEALATSMRTVGWIRACDFNDNVLAHILAADVRELVARVRAAEAGIRDAYEAGYERGHNDTVEDCWTDRTEAADEYMEERNR